MPAFNQNNENPLENQAPVQEQAPQKVGLFQGFLNLISRLWNAMTDGFSFVFRLPGRVRNGTIQPDHSQEAVEEQVQILDGEDQQIDNTQLLGQDEPIHQQEPAPKKEDEGRLLGQMEDPYVDDVKNLESKLNYINEFQTHLDAMFSNKYVPQFSNRYKDSYVTSVVNGKAKTADDFALKGILKFNDAKYQDLDVAVLAFLATADPSLSYYKGAHTVGDKKVSGDALIQDRFSKMFDIQSGKGSIFNDTINVVAGAERRMRIRIDEINNGQADFESFARTIGNGVKLLNQMLKNADRLDDRFVIMANMAKRTQDLLEKNPELMSALKADGITLDKKVVDGAYNLGQMYVHGMEAEKQLLANSENPELNPQNKMLLAAVAQRDYQRKCVDTSGIQEALEIYSDPTTEATVNETIANGQGFQVYQSNPEAPVTNREAARWSQNYKITDTLYEVPFGINMNEERMKALGIDTEIKAENVQKLNMERQQEQDVPQINPL